METTVAVRDLQKNYGPVQAVRGISFEIRKGEIFGLLGPNGAGKTTTLECLIGLRQPDQGSIEVCGVDALKRPREARQKTGVQLQSTSLQDKITPREALNLFAGFYRHPVDTESLLERFTLKEKADAYYDTLSGGQKQRLAIALALVNNPEFLLLDEPTASLDPQSRRELHEVIRNMRGDGRTVLLTTHHIEEAAQLCDRIAIVDHGRIIATGTPRELTSRSSVKTRVVLSTVRPLDLAKLKTLASVQDAQTNHQGCILNTTKVNETIIDVVKHLEAERNELLDLHIQQSSLEDVFIELTGHSLRD